MSALATARTVLDDKTRSSNASSDPKRDTRPMICIQDVIVEYGQPGKPPKRILNGLNLDIHPGEFISIVGQTGCGKSTLLRLVLAEEMPAHGQVLVEGSPRKQPDRRCGYVPQKYSLFPDRTVLDNITFGLEVTEIGIFGRISPARRVRRHEFQAEAIGYLRRMGLRESDAAKYPHQLSGGMQQRVAIARALACDPVLLLMDEPFGAVDAQTREDLEDLLLRVRAERHITTLLVTHDIDESVYTGDRVLVLTQGPGRVRAEVIVDLPAPRDQITTRELREFARLRAEVSRLVRGTRAQALHPPDN